MLTTIRPSLEFFDQYKIRLFNASKIYILPTSSTNKSLGAERPANDVDDEPLAKPATVTPDFDHVALIEQIDTFTILVNGFNVVCTNDMTTNNRRF